MLKGGSFTDGVLFVCHFILALNLIKEILDELNKLASSQELWGHHCLVVCLMSHGKEGVITASDNRDVAVTEVLNIFSRCEALKGKPKLMFIQACRGSEWPGVFYIYVGLKSLKVSTSITDQSTDHA